MMMLAQLEKDSVYYLEKAPVPGAIAHMAIPMILGMAVNMIYNIIDAFFIGQLNNTAMLAAITLALPFVSILMGIGQIFGIGGSTYISRLLGERNREGAKKASSVNFYLSLSSGIVFMLVCLPLLSPILHVLGASGENLRYTRDFILAFAIGSPFVITHFTLSETVRGEGASTQSMIGMILSVVINIILDPIFIFLFGNGHGKYMRCCLLCLVSQCKKQDAERQYKGFQTEQGDYFQYF
jgi:Na+-driven multidrug efflux pump